MRNFKKNKLRFHENYMNYFNGTTNAQRQCKQENNDRQEYEEIFAQAVFGRLAKLHVLI
jgi:hypothetical protein